MKTRPFKEAAAEIEAGKGMHIRDYMIGRLRAGATMTALAAELRVDRTALYRHLRNYDVEFQRTLVVHKTE